MWHFVVLIACAALIYLSCEWFVNAVEWLGTRLNVGKMAIGTILAAFGTALPESVVTLVAVTTGHSAEAKNIGVGAAMGGPLVLSTLAYGVTGSVLLLRRRRLGHASRAHINDDSREGHKDSQPEKAVFATAKEMTRLAKDQTWFLPIFVVKVSLGLVVFQLKPVLGAAFFAAYAVYFWRELRNKDDSGTLTLEPLKFQPKKSHPSALAIAAQTVITVGVIFISSQIFVKQLDAVAPMLSLSTAVTALLLSPVATELPEIMNAIIWTRHGETNLALANISGAMMIQATVPSGLGIIFTAWKFDAALVWSGIITTAAIVYLLTTMLTHKLTPSKLATAALFYAIFAVGLVVM